MIRTRDEAQAARPRSPSLDRSMRQCRSRRMDPSTPGRAGGVRQTAARGRERRARSRPHRPPRPGHKFAAHAHSRCATVQSTSAGVVRQVKGGRPTRTTWRQLPPEREPDHASGAGARSAASRATPAFRLTRFVLETRTHRGRLFDRLDQLDLAAEHVIIQYVVHSRVALSESLAQPSVDPNRMSGTPLQLRIRHVSPTVITI